MKNPEAGRRAAHVFLDASIAVNDDTPDDDGRTLQLAIEGLYDIDCVTATIDDETGAAHVDITDLTGGAMVLIHALVERVANVTGLDREVVVAQTREIIDKSF